MGHWPEYGWSSYEDMNFCDPVICLKSSATHSASKGLIIYSYSEMFPGMISLWHFNKYSINNNLLNLPTTFEKEYIKEGWLIETGS